MINLDNKQERLALAARFLDAETTVQEEQMLARYYATHPVESDEKEFAAMLAVSRSEADSSLLADTSEFDSIVGKPVSKQHTILALTAAAAAVSLMIILPLSLRHKPAQSVMSEQDEQSIISTSQIMEGMEMLSKIEVGEIESIYAQPTGNTVLITLRLKNGKEKTYIMSCDANENSMSFIALN